MAGAVLSNIQMIARDAAIELGMAAMRGDDGIDVDCRRARPNFSVHALELRLRIKEDLLKQSLHRKEVMKHIQILRRQMCENYFEL